MLHNDCNCTCLKLDIKRIIGDCWSRCFQELDNRVQDTVLNEAIEDALIAALRCRRVSFVDCHLGK